MSDLIDRQAAIDAVNTIFAVTPTQKDVVMDCIEAIVAVPSAQPEIIRCKECKYWDVSGYCVDFMTQDENGFCSWAERRIDE